MVSPRLTVDFNDTLASGSGAGGLSDEAFAGLAPVLDEALSSIDAQRREGGLAWLKLPTDHDARRASEALAAELRQSFDTLVVLGIGGSSLGARAAFGALSHPFHNLRAPSERGGMRIFFPDNSDPATFAALLETLDLSKTAFAAITKSGGTAETLSQLSVVKARLDTQGPQAFARQVVAITDPEKGALRSIARRFGLRTLPVPPDVGGRFSVLTACGLLPAACAGIDVEALCAGAADMVSRFEKPARENPAALLAGVLHTMDTRLHRPLHVLMPYCDALRDTGDWFVQLWAESLGKTRKDGPVGPTPLRAVGATDQHSLLQLLMEGPQDKFVTFVAVGEPRVDLEIPNAFPDEPDTTYLAGLPLSKLLDTERRATAMALAKRERPSATLHLPKLDAFHLGELLQLFECATAVAGELYEVNPYDQPGVELGKRYTGGILGRAGYEADGREVASRAAPRRELIIG